MSRDTLHAITSRHQTTSTTTGEELLALAEETLTLSFFFLLRCTRVSIRANIAWGPGGMPPSRPISHPEFYPNEPEKFVDDEVALNDALLAMKDAAAYVNLYSELVRGGSDGELLDIART